MVINIATNIYHNVSITPGVITKIILWDKLALGVKNWENKAVKKN